MSHPIPPATVAIPPTTRPDPPPLDWDGPHRRLDRVAQEMMGGEHSHPWGVDHASQIPAYLGCWRHAAAALKQGGPAIQVEFNSARVTRNPEFKSLDLYPGDDAADGWSIQYYDGGPLKSTQAIWDKIYAKTDNKDLFGLGTWLTAAKAHSKTFAVAEWGVWRQSDLTSAQADDPVFVDNMYRFFRDN